MPGHDLATALPPPPPPRERRQGPSRLGGWTHVVKAILCVFFLFGFFPKKIFTKKKNRCSFGSLMFDFFGKSWMIFFWASNLILNGWWMLVGLLSSAFVFFQCDLLTGLRKIEVLDVLFLHTSSTSKKTHTRMATKSFATWIDSGSYCWWTKSCTPWDG